VSTVVSGMGTPPTEQVIGIRATPLEADCRGRERRCRV